VIPVVNEAPRTRYVESPEGLHIAYQVLGDGPLDVAFLPMNWGNVEVYWEDPFTARFFRRLASVGRLIWFDKRGTGLSDPVAMRAVPTVEEWVDDLMLVLDAVGSRQAHLFGTDSGGPPAILAAGTHPARFPTLVLLNTFARLGRTPDYPIGFPDSLQKTTLARFRRDFADGVYHELMMPSRAGEPAFREWWARFGRFSVGLGAALQMQQASFELDVRDVLPAVHQPTLVLQRADNAYVLAAHGRYLAKHLPNATYVELPGNDHLFNSPDVDVIADHIEEFLTGAPATPDVDRVLATVVFTDIVNSTQQAVELGDRRWKDLLDHHDDVVRQALARFRGRQVKTTGDGVLAIFDGPARAIGASVMIRDTLRSAGLEMRCGVHTAEIELRGDDIGGIGVHIASRISALAGSGEVLASRTVVDLVAGSGLEFDDRGAHELKGVPGSWPLFAVRE
jgi:class 3 adenylate cyclase